MAHIMALVVEGAADTFQLAVGKEHLALHGAYVMQEEQMFAYRTAAGERFTLPVKCFEGEPAATCLTAVGTSRAKASQLKETARIATLDLYAGQQQFGMMADVGLAVSAAMTECLRQPAATAAAATDAKKNTAREGQEEKNADMGGDNQPAATASAGVAAGLAAGTAQPRVSAWKGLEMLGFTAPHVYYRGTAYLGSFLCWALWWGWQLISLGLDTFGVPTQAWGAACLLYGAQAYDWWQGRLKPVPAFQEPTSPRQPSRRWRSWHAEFVFRVQRRKQLTASVQRHAKRYTAAVKQHDSAVVQHKAVTACTSISLRGLLPLLLLTFTCLLGQAAAVPDLLRGVHLLTNSLAAWELSQLSKSNFAAAADYNSLAGHSAGQLRTAAAAQRLLQHYAMTGPSQFPAYPGAADPLQLEDLLPDGQQFSAAKDSYAPDPEHKWSYGQHPQMADSQQQQLKAMLLRNKGAFAYSMKELPGYTGDLISVELVHDKPIVSKPRPYSKLETEIRDEK
jgi:hypothetical protein